MPRIMTAAAELRARPERNSEVLAGLVVGDVFDVLEFSGDHAWGVAPGPGLVGYVDAAALSAPVKL